MVKLLRFDEEKSAILPKTTPNNNQESKFTHQAYVCDIREDEKICKRFGRS